MRHGSSTDSFINENFKKRKDLTTNFINEYVKLVSTEKMTQKEKLFDLQNLQKSIEQNDFSVIFKSFVDSLFNDYMNIEVAEDGMLVDEEMSNLPFFIIEQIATIYALYLSVLDKEERTIHFEDYLWG